MPIPTYASNLTQGHIDELDERGKELVGMLIFALQCDKDTDDAATKCMEELRSILAYHHQSDYTGS